jgi:hypothetical protein
MVRLEEEVELLKISIKRLLIDLRERMNDMDNPFLQKALSGSAAAGPGGSTGQLQATGSGNGPGSGNPGPEPGTGPAPPTAPVDAVTAGNTQKPMPTPDDLVVRGIRNQLATMGGGVIDAESVEGKVRLQMVFRLFAWTTKNVRLFGHDRVDLMLESYRAMGYISPESCSLVKDIARLMPSTLGEQHEINAEEYVTELYELNHILNPGDVSLDRDMIEVLIKKRIASGGEVSAQLLDRAGTETDTRDGVRKKDRI